MDSIKTKPSKSSGFFDMSNKYKSGDNMFGFFKNQNKSDLRQEISDDDDGFASFSSSDNFTRSDNPTKDNGLVTVKVPRSTKKVLDIDSTLDYLSGFRDMMSNTVNDAKFHHDGVWVSYLEYREVSKRKITKGMFYLSNGNNLSAHQENPTVVNIKKANYPPLPTMVGANSYKDSSLGYWPSYDLISPKCRGAYLDWLASDRSNPDIPISYVFIYYGGLEYRIISDPKETTDSEYLTIYKEVVRLHSIYSHNYSFNSHALGFISYLSVLRPDLIDAYEEKLLTDSGVLTPGITPDLKVMLAKKINKSIPICSNSAWEWLTWLNNRGLYSFKMPYYRLTAEYIKLFTKFYNEQYTNGMLIKDNGTQLRVTYNPSNLAITAVRSPQSGLVDIVSYIKEVNGITDIADLCSKALDSASRYLAKDETSKDDLAAILLMPQFIIKEIASQENSVIAGMRTWILQVLEEDNGLVSSEDMLLQLSSSLDNSMTLIGSTNNRLSKEGKLLTSLFDALGFGLVPDKRYHNEDINRFETIVILKDAHPKDFVVSVGFHDAKSVIALATTIIKKGYEQDINDNPDSQAINIYEVAPLIMSTIEEVITLTESEHKSLEAYVLWRLTNNNNVVKLKPKKNHFKLLDNVDSKTAELVIAAAFADGIFNIQKITAAEKVYKYLGFDIVAIPGLIHRLQTTNSVLTTERTDSGLDFEKLREYEQQTKSSASILHAVFSDDESHVDKEHSQDQATIVDVDSNAGVLAPESVNEPENASESMTSAIEGLDDEHADIYKQLIKKEVWRTEEVELMCQNLNLMLSGVVETINDWAYDNIDASVVEEDDGEIIIDYESVEEINNIN